MGAALVAILASAPLAAAAPATADQYGPSPIQRITGPDFEANQPVAQPGPVPDGDGPPGPGPGGPGGPVFQEAGQAGGGELPFTGYPLTPLVLIVLALIALGLAIRGGIALRERRSTAV